MTDTFPTTLDGWLSYCYAADRKKQLLPAITQFRAALKMSADMTTDAQTRMAEINDLIKKRGRMACAYSANYGDYLQEVLSA